MRASNERRRGSADVKEEASPTSVWDLTTSLERIGRSSAPCFQLRPIISLVAWRRRPAHGRVLSAPLRCSGTRTVVVGLIGSSCWNMNSDANC
jgi:hypothetical protein